MIASGPSLCQADIDLVRRSGIKTVAVNSTGYTVPWCDVLVACDLAWWRNNTDILTISADKWTTSRSAAGVFQLNYRENKIWPGYNSGACAVEITANLFGADPVLMLGFDCSVKYGLHHHANHKNTSNPTHARCEKWKAQFKHLVKICPHTSLINCSRYTEIKCIERADLEASLCEHGLI